MYMYVYVHICVYAGMCMHEYVYMYIRVYVGIYVICNYFNLQNFVVNSY